MVSIMFYNRPSPGYKCYRAESYNNLHNVHLSRESTIIRRCQICLLYCDLEGIRTRNASGETVVSCL